VASGEAILTPAWLEPESGFGPAGVRTRAVPDGDGVRLRGTKRHVPFASSAAPLLVLARTGDGERDVDLFLVDPAAPGVRLTQQLSVASDTQYEVVLDDVAVGADARIGPAGSGWATWDAVMHDAIVLLAAQAMGGARRALDITVQYAKDRRQFDKPLGAFQAIAHYLSDAVTAVDGGTSLVHEAAWARATGRPEARRLAAMAKLFACQTYRDVTAMAQQVFGGIGFTVEFDIQLYFRRAKALQLSWWDTRYLEELVAAAVLDGGAPGGAT
jgi:alkylation response protein AidB-like acyl-CoA dehydrogenase